MRPLTTVKTELAPANLTFRNSLFDTYLDVKLQAQTDIGYESREVYTEIGNERFWLTAEQAIQFGQHLIEQGTKAFEMNMIKHQLIHHQHQLEQFIREGRVAKTIFNMVNDKPAYFGSGFKEFLITPEWIEGKEPKYQEDFSFEQVIFFSPFPEEFEAQLKEFGGREKVEFINYDYEAEVEAFNKAIREMGNGSPDNPEHKVGVDLSEGKDYTSIDGKLMPNENPKEENE